MESKVWIPKSKIHHHHPQRPLDSNVWNPKAGFFFQFPFIKNTNQALFVIQNPRTVTTP
jgi:hypothetical protein